MEFIELMVFLGFPVIFTVILIVAYISFVRDIHDDDKERKKNYYNETKTK